MRERAFANANRESENRDRGSNILKNEVQILDKPERRLLRRVRLNHDLRAKTPCIPLEKGDFLKLAAFFVFFIFVLIKIINVEKFLKID